MIRVNDHDWLGLVCVRCGCSASSDRSNHIFGLARDGHLSREQVVRFLGGPEPHPDGCDASLARRILES